MKVKEESETVGLKLNNKSLMDFKHGGNQIFFFFYFLKFFPHHLSCRILFPQEVPVAQSCPTLCDPMGPSRLLYPWNSSGNNTGVRCLFLLQVICQPRDRTWVSCTAGRLLSPEPPWKLHQSHVPCSGSWSLNQWAISEVFRFSLYQITLLMVGKIS